MDIKLATVLIPLMFLGKCELISPVNNDITVIPKIKIKQDDFDIQKSDSTFVEQTFTEKKSFFS